MQLDWVACFPHPQRFPPPFGNLFSSGIDNVGTAPVVWAKAELRLARFDLVRARAL